MNETAVIGCGYWGKNLVRNFANLGALNTICDSNPDQLETFLDQFQVVPILGEAAPLLSVEGDIQEASRWSLRKLIPAPGYVAALAVEGKGWRLAQWHYSD